MAQQRTQWIDLARGIAILLVVAHHAVLIAVDVGLLGSFDGLLPLNRVFRSLHNPVFFFVAGWLFFPSFTRKAGPGEYLSIKVDQLIYPCLLWGLVQLSLDAVQGDLVLHANRLPIELFEQLIWAPSNHFWFLPTLFCCYALQSLLTLAFQPNRVVPVTLLLGCALCWLVPTASEPNMIISVMEYFLFFGLGATAGRWLAEQEGRKLPSPRLVAGMAIGCFALLHGLLYVRGCPMQLRELSAPWRIGLAAAGVGLVVAIARLTPARIARHGAWIGRYTLEIYLLHCLFGGVVRIVLLRLFGIDNPWIHMALFVAAGLTMPVLFAMVVKRWHLDFLWRPPAGQSAAGFYARLRKSPAT